jgi:hypothetical protein
MDAEPVEQVDDVRGKANADAHVGEGVLEDEVPADDPGDEFAERGVGVGVGRAGDGDHAREFGVAEAGEAADDGDQDKRERKCGTRARPAGDGTDVPVKALDDEVDDGGLIPGAGGCRVAADGGADDGEDARADDGSDTERGERDGTEGLFKRVLRGFGVGDQLVDRFGGEDLAGQGCGPRRVGWCGVDSMRKQNGRSLSSARCGLSKDTLLSFIAWTDRVLPS